MSRGQTVAKGNDDGCNRRRARRRGPALTAARGEQCKNSGGNEDGDVGRAPRVPACSNDALHDCY